MVKEKRIEIGEYDGYGFNVWFNGKDNNGDWLKQPKLCVSIGVESIEEADELKVKLNG